MTGQSSICVAPVSNLCRLAHRVCILIVILAAGCTAPYPLLRQEVWSFGRSDTALTSDEAAYARTLQIRWLGTACYLIQLGDVAVLTDPFFSYHGLWETAFGTLESNPDRVRAKTADLPKPRAIFIGHSHYDHLLDLAEVIRQRDWFDVPTFGSETTKNILHGYGPDFVTYTREQFRDAQTDGAAHAITADASLSYQAVVSEHAPHVGSLLLFDGEQSEPRTSPPTRASDFPVGITYAYLFTFRGAEAEFNVYFTGAASNFPVGMLEEPVPPIDVAIMTVPGWKNVEGYPQAFVRALRPRHIVLSHFDDFFDDAPAPRRTAPTSDLSGFLEAARGAALGDGGYPEFERLVMLDVDSILHVNPR